MQALSRSKHQPKVRTNEKQATHAGGLRTTGYSLGFVPVPRVILRAEVKEFVDQSNAYRKGKAYQHTNAAVTTLLGLTFWSS